MYRNLKQKEMNSTSNFSLFQERFSMSLSYPSTSISSVTDNTRFFKPISLNNFSEESILIDYFSSLFFLSPFEAVANEKGETSLTFFLIKDKHQFPNSKRMNSKSTFNDYNDFLLFFSQFIKTKLNSSFNISNLFTEFVFKEQVFWNSDFLPENISNCSKLQKEILERIKKEIELSQSKETLIDSSFADYLKKIEEFFLLIQMKKRK